MDYEDEDPRLDMRHYVRYPDDEDPAKYYDTIFNLRGTLNALCGFSWVPADTTEENYDPRCNHGLCPDCKLLMDLIS